MCGICGYMQKEKITSNDTIISIKDSILKRGNSDNNVYINDNVALGHARLSIIDVKNGKQPMKRKINNIVERKHPIERTLDIMCKNKKIKILNSKNKLIDYDEEEKRAKQHFNIDNEISDIFKEENIHSKLKDKKNSVKKIMRRHK